MRSLSRNLAEAAAFSFVAVIIAYFDGSIDLSEAVADSVFTAIPVRDLCAEDCRGICPHCGINLNRGSCDCRETGVDPRWAGLASLLKQD